MPLLQHAQLSLEYAILLAAFFSCLLIVFPQALSLYHAALFALDARNAEGFLFSLKSEADEIAFLSDGSSAVLSASPLLEWSISSDGKLLELTVYSKSLGKEKTLSAQTIEQLSIEPATLNERFELVLRKEEEKILGEYTNS